MPACQPACDACRMHTHTIDLHAACRRGLESAAWLPHHVAAAARGAQPDSVARTHSAPGMHGNTIGLGAQHCGHVMCPFRSRFTVRVV
eukprot:361510-Chlamydomonas_euryale.AAC.3